MKTLLLSHVDILQVISDAESGELVGTCYKVIVIEEELDWKVS